MRARRVTTLAAWALSLFAVGAQAQKPAPPPAAAASEDLLIAVYLPGMYFPQLSARLELGEELAVHLSQAMGRHATARVYATAESLENDSAKLAMALVEAPYAAARLQLLTPLCAATVSGHDDTRLLILGTGELKGAEDLRRFRLAYASMAFEEEAFLSNFVFEGDLQLGREHLEPARDASSALSKVPLKKAEAVLLYEDDAALAQRAGMHTIYTTAPLPRPTMVVFDKNQDTSQVQRLREAMVHFTSKVHPQLRDFRPAQADRYLALRWQMQRRSPRLLPLLELAREEPLPLPASSTPPATLATLPAPPLRQYLPDLRAR